MYSLPNFILLMKLAPCAKRMYVALPLWLTRLQDAELDILDRIADTVGTFPCRGGQVLLQMCDRLHFRGSGLLSGTDVPDRLPSAPYSMQPVSDKTVGTIC